MEQISERKKSFEGSKMLSHINLAICKLWWKVQPCFTKKNVELQNSPAVSISFFLRSNCKQSYLRSTWPLHVYTPSMFIVDNFRNRGFPKSDPKGGSNIQINPHCGPAAVAEKFTHARATRTISVG